MTDLLRPLYDEVIARTSHGDDVVFEDEMNKFIDDLVFFVKGEEWREVGSTGNPDYQNSWESFSAGRGAHFKKVGDKVVVKGVVKNGLFPNQTIFNLPEGYRPLNNRLFATSSNGNFCNVIVFSNGDVRINSGGSASFTCLEFQYYL